MQAYTGFEPRVGEIRAVRTFRIGAGGRLYALSNGTRWRNGTNTARCEQPQLNGAPPHAAPNPDCTCGNYAYASPAGAAEDPNSRHVLAVVACWGRIVAGSRGIRAEHARIEALWISAAVPLDVAAQTLRRYPSAWSYERRSRMLAAHPPTRLDSYAVERPWARVALHLAVASALIVGLMPWHRLRASPTILTIWLAEVVLFLVAAVSTERRHGRGVSARTVFFGAVVLGLLAPLGGAIGGLLLRAPLAVGAATRVVRRLRTTRTAGRIASDFSEIAP